MLANFRKNWTKTVKGVQVWKKFDDRHPSIHPPRHQSHIMIISFAGCKPAAELIIELLTVHEVNAQAQECSTHLVRHTCS